jgi:hypothetical protein
MAAPYNSFDEKGDRHEGVWVPNKQECRGAGSPRELQFLALGTALVAVTADARS